MKVYFISSVFTIVYAGVSSHRPSVGIDGFVSGIDYVDTVQPSKLIEHPDEHFRKEWEKTVLQAQDYICDNISKIEGKPFHEDLWRRGSSGGGGRTRVLENGKVFEKAGVNVSAVKGRLPKAAAKEMASRVGADLDNAEDLNFYACGLSLVIHPRNPRAPTAHCNYRMFQLFDGEKPLTWWFGGGSDLTPALVYREDAEHFHSVLENVCSRHGSDLYPRFKQWCDEYFFMPHREETRGIGGIFFDDLNEGGKPGPIKEFAGDCLNAFVDAYVPLVEKRMDENFSDGDKKFQQQRRGRYAEYNLVYDRGTKFGLATPGSRVESILMSLPETARWDYDPKPVNDWEKQSMKAFKEPQDWLKKGVWAKNEVTGKWEQVEAPSENYVTPFLRKFRASRKNIPVPQTILDQNDTF